MRLAASMFILKVTILVNSEPLVITLSVSLLHDDVLTMVHRDLRH